MVKINPSHSVHRIEGNNPLRAEKVTVVAIIAGPAGKTS